MSCQSKLHLEVQEDGGEKGEGGVAVAVHERLGRVRPHAGRVGRGQRRQRALHIDQPMRAPLGREVADLHQASIACTRVLRLSSGYPNYYHENEFRTLLPE